jgi:hypothetical protein
MTTAPLPGLGPAARAGITAGELSELLGRPPVLPFFSADCIVRS